MLRYMDGFRAGVCVSPRQGEPGLDRLVHYLARDRLSRYQVQKPRRFSASLRKSESPSWDVVFMILDHRSVGERGIGRVRI
jgi:hypothetical protein